MQWENWQVNASELKHCSSFNDCIFWWKASTQVSTYLMSWCWPPPTFKHFYSPIILPIDLTLMLNYTSWTENNWLWMPQWRWETPGVPHPKLMESVGGSLIHRDSGPQSTGPKGFITNMQGWNMSEYLSDVILHSLFKERKCRSHSTLGDNVMFWNDKFPPGIHWPFQMCQFSITS